MLDIDEYLSLDVLNIKNYTNLFQEWYQKKYKESPIYQIKENKEGGYTVYFSLKTSKGETKYQESAQSKSKARALLAETMYKDLITLNEIPSIKSEFASKITYELSINTLQELYQKKIISEPIYQTPDKQVYDNNGNPVWTCACYVESHKVKYEIAASSKSDAKKKAAYACLSEIYNSL